MRILDVDPDDQDNSIESGRAVVRAEIEHPSKTIVLIRGDSPQIARFADRASAQCDSVVWREAVWVKDSRIFPEGWEERFFGSDSEDECCGVVVGDNDQTERKLDHSMSARVINSKILEVERGDD